MTTSSPFKRHSLLLVPSISAPIAAATRLPNSWPNSSASAPLSLSCGIRDLTITITCGQLPRGKQNPLAADHIIIRSRLTDARPHQQSAADLGTAGCEPGAHGAGDPRAYRHQGGH